MPIPDHDGRPLSPDARRELNIRLAEIDRTFAGEELARRAVRAQACRNFGDELGEARELGAMSMEAGFMRGLSARSLDRLTMPTCMYLSRNRKGRLN